MQTWQILALSNFHFDTVEPAGFKTQPVSISTCCGGSIHTLMHGEQTPDLLAYSV
jgi:hypothetical protein